LGTLRANASNRVPAFNWAAVGAARVRVVTQAIFVNPGGAYLAVAAGMDYLLFLSGLGYRFRNGFWFSGGGFVEAPTGRLVNFEVRLFSDEAGRLVVTEGGMNDVNPFGHVRLLLLDGRER